jgi:ribosomal-protein-alanine N-acetyltransferase
MNRAAAQGAVAMFLEVAVTNTAARALYAAHGFTEAGLRRRYYSDGTDALVLRSTLPSGAGDS